MVSSWPRALQSHAQLIPRPRPPSPPPHPPMGKGGESVRGWRMCLSSSSCSHASSSLTAASAAARRGCEGVADVPRQQQLLPRFLPSHGCACCCGGSGGEGVRGWRMFFVRPVVAHAAPAPPPPPPPPLLVRPPADRTAGGVGGMGVAGVANDEFLPVARPAVARAGHSPPPPPSPPSLPPMGRGGEGVRGWRMCLSSSSCRHASSSLTAASAAVGRGCEGVADVPPQQQLLPRLLPSHGCACCCGGVGERV
ncbi:unnamed protein product [Closterium sp. NIES-53]